MNSRTILFITATAQDEEDMGGKPHHRLPKPLDTYPITRGCNGNKTWYSCGQSIPNSEENCCAFMGIDEDKLCVESNKEDSHCPCIKNETDCLNDVLCKVEYKWWDEEENVNFMPFRCIRKAHFIGAHTLAPIKIELEQGECGHLTTKSACDAMNLEGYCEWDEEENKCKLVKCEHREDEGSTCVLNRCAKSKQGGSCRHCHHYELNNFPTDCNSQSACQHIKGYCIQATCATYSANTSRVLSSEEKDLCNIMGCEIDNDNSTDNAFHCKERGGVNGAYRAFASVFSLVAITFLV